MASRSKARALSSDIANSRQFARAGSGARIPPARPRTNARKATAPTSVWTLWTIRGGRRSRLPITWTRIQAASVGTTALTSVIDAAAVARCNRLGSPPRRLRCTNARANRRTGSIRMSVSRMAPRTAMAPTRVRRWTARSVTPPATVVNARRSFGRSCPTPYQSCGESTLDVDSKRRLVKSSRRRSAIPCEIWSAWTSSDRESRKVSSYSFSSAWRSSRSRVTSGPSAGDFSSGLGPSSFRRIRMASARGVSSAMTSRVPVARGSTVCLMACSASSDLPRRSIPASVWASSMRMASSLDRCAAMIGEGGA